MSYWRVNERNGTVRLMLTAGGQGLEPRYSGPKPDVLPLDDPPAVSTN